MVGAWTCNIVKSHIHSLGSATHKLKNNLYHRSSPTGMRVLGPMSGSQAWGSYIEMSEPPEYLALKGNEVWVQELHRTGENRLHSWRACLRSHTHWDQGQKCLHNLGHNYLQVLEGLLGRQGRGQLQLILGQGHRWCTHWGAFISMSSPGQHFGTETQPHPTACSLQY